MDKKTSELFSSLYQKMLLDKENNISDYINDDNQLKKFEYIELDNNLKILIRLFELNHIFNCDIAIIYDEQVLQKLFFKESNDLELIEDEYIKLVDFAKKSSIFEILDKGKVDFCWILFKTFILKGLQLLVL